MSKPGLNSLIYRVRPGTEHPLGALVLLHGRGADEHDLYSLLDVLDPQRRLLGVTPRAPFGLPPGGAQWYVTRQAGHPDPDTFRPTYHLVSAWLDALAEETGIPPARTAIGGFSQGTVMAYALGLGPDRPRPAAIVALSGYIPTVEGFEVDLDRPLPPIAIGHGTYDDLIPVGFARRARDLLERAGAAVRYHESPLAHTIDPMFLVELVPWIRKRLPD